MRCGGLLGMLSLLDSQDSVGNKVSAVRIVSAVPLGHGAVCPFIAVEWNAPSIFLSQV